MLESWLSGPGVSGRIELDGLPYIGLQARYVFLSSAPVWESMINGLAWSGRSTRILSMDEMRDRGGGLCRVAISCAGLQELREFRRIAGSVDRLKREAKIRYSDSRCWRFSLEPIGREAFGAIEIWVKWLPSGSGSAAPDKLRATRHLDEVEP
jgi:hypothetical protein